MTKKKQELAKKKIKPATLRSNLTSYISKELKSRQEYVPLFERYIDLAKSEPLHLKNNTVKELYMKVMKIVLSQTKISQGS